ncbi:MAG: SRPBCC domain-containing protein [Pyrinomonadaceae bacterium]
MKIRIETEVEKDIETVWSAWTSPEDIVNWNAASPDWHTVSATNDLRTGGEFSYRMEAKDGSMGFDFGGKYTNVEEGRLLEILLGDDREMRVWFEESEKGTRVFEEFETEDQNPVEMQRQGWQNILDNFKAYVEAK